MNIGIIGSGAMGTCLARKLIHLGHTISIANSRGAVSIKHLTDDIGAKAVTVEEAIVDKSLIILAIPQKSISNLPGHLFKDLREDVVVIDLGNYYPTLRDNVIPSLEETGIDSWWVQQQLGCPVIKVFNSISAASLENMGRPKGDKNRVALAVSGDNAKAKELVCQLVDDLGFDPFNIGTILQSWKQQPGSPIYCRDISWNELAKRVHAMGDEWPAMREAILGKRKTDEKIMREDYPAYLKSLT